MRSINRNNKISNLLKIWLLSIMAGFMLVVYESKIKIDDCNKYVFYYRVKRANTRTIVDTTLYHNNLTKNDNAR